MQGAEFGRNVFINCPLDADYDGLLQAILFCLVYLGFSPRIATERMESAENRLEKIKGLIEGSKYSIHDLSRCQAKEEGEFYRLNMPFELGIDYGCKHYSNDHRSEKRILILEAERYRYQVSLSDLSGCDIQVHGNDFETATRKVRNWFVAEASIEAAAGKKISTEYFEFQEWYYEKQLKAGFSEEDIQDYPTRELLTAMNEWVEKVS